MFQIARDIKSLPYNIFDLIKGSEKYTKKQCFWQEFNMHDFQLKQTFLVCVLEVQKRAVVLKKYEYLMKFYQYHN